VLGLQGKFDEARQVAALDMSDQEAKSNMTYLRNMLSNPTQFAAATPGDSEAPADDWEPFDAADAKSAAASKSVAATPMPKMHVVQAAEEIEAPSAAQAKGAQAPAPAKPRKVAGTASLITPANATPTPGGAAGLLRTDTD
jgi:hypothetical protein